MPALPGIRVLTSSCAAGGGHSVSTMSNDTATTARTSNVFLWLFLAVSAVINAAGPLVGLSEPARMAAGGVAIVCVTLLVVQRVRRRAAR